MRVIKFRAWDEGNRVMHNDFQFIKSGDEGNDWIVFTSNRQLLSNKPHPFENPYFSQQLKIMQFTGLHDKNGNEIWESDIIQCCDPDDQAKAVVVMGKFGWMKHYGNKMEPYDLTEFDLHWFDVVGNIYETPELLEQKK